MFARNPSIAVSAARSAILLLALASLGGCPNAGTSDTDTTDTTDQSGTVTVNVIAAENAPTYDWARYVTLGEHTFPMSHATKSFSDSLQQPFIDTQFNTPGPDSDRFNWAGYVPEISSGVTVPAAPPGFASGFTLMLHYSSDTGSYSTLKFTAYEGTVNITSVSGNTISFQATARMELDGRLSSAAPGSLGYIDVSVSGTTTLVDE